MLAFLWWGKKRARWPEVAPDEVRRRSRMLVIDDKDFAYLDLFRRDGYAVDKWDDVEDLPKLERGVYDLVLLDIHGVGARLSKDQGMGVLRHLKQAAPTVLVVAYSDAEWTLEYKPFFDTADASLYKGADYVDFKRKIDDLLSRRFTLEFYVDRILEAASPIRGDKEKIRAGVERAILARSTDDLQQTLLDAQVDETRLHTAIGIAQVGIGILQLVAAL